MTEELQRALEHMDLQYQRIRRARASAEMSSEDARRSVLNLAHHDAQGRTWQIDLPHSGRDAGFAITADVAVSDDLGLDLIRDRYASLVQAYEQGQLSSEETKERIRELSHTDSLGRTWRIDTTRAGRTAAVKVTDHLDPTADPGLELLGHQYTTIVHEFEAGHLTADDARRRVRNLAYTDSGGRTWHIDTVRSGRTPRFTQATPSAQHAAATSGGSTRRGPAVGAAGHAGSGHPDSQDFGVRHPGAELPTGEVPVVAPSRSAARSSARRPARRWAVPKAAVWSVAAALVIVPLTFVVSAQLSSDRSDSSASGINPGTGPTATNDDGSNGNTDTTADPTESTQPPTVTDEPLGDLPTIGDLTAEQVPYETPMEFGRSVQDRPLVVERRGSSSGARVLVVGVIHGNEQAGLAVADLLEDMELGEHLDLWLVRSMNPDGVAANVRQNANGVDLNRNFTVKWQPIGQRGFWQYAGPSAASEPETKAMMSLAKMIQPDVVIWYHQDYFRIEPKSGREGNIRALYAGLVQLPLLPISGGSYSGTANGWVRTVLAPAGMSMTVEIGPALREGEAQAHADALITIVEEYWGPNPTDSGSALP